MEGVGGHVMEGRAVGAGEGWSSCFGNKEWCGPKEVSFQVVV